MKNTGVIRRLDELGRITLPMELRKSMNLKERDALQISVDNGRVVLEKYTPCDIFTGATEDLVEFRGKKISKSLLCHLSCTRIHSFTEQPVCWFSFIVTHCTAFASEYAVLSCNLLADRLKSNRTYFPRTIVSLKG